MEHQTNQCRGTKVRLVISYGGKLVRKNPENPLFYVGGESKFLVVDRNMKYFDIVTVIVFACGLKTPCKLKYLSPGNKDLDELVSVVCDEDVQNMMDEYNNIYLSATKMPERMRLFVLEPTTKSQRVPLQRSDSVPNPDYLFGFDKKYDPDATPVKLHVPEFPDKREFVFNQDNEKEKQVEEKKQLTTEETMGIMKTKPCDNNVTSGPTGTFAYITQTLPPTPLIYWTPGFTVVHQTTYVPSWYCYEQPGTYSVMTTLPNHS